MTMHRFDPLSFVFGVVFVAVAIVGLIAPELLSFTDLRWIAPGALVVLGALLLALSGRSRADTPDDRRADDVGSAAAVAGSGPRATGPDASTDPRVTGGPDASGGPHAASEPDADASSGDDGTTLTQDTVEGDRPER